MQVDSTGLGKMDRKSLAFTLAFISQKQRGEALDPFKIGKGTPAPNIKGFEVGGGATASSASASPADDMSQPPNTQPSLLKYHAFLTHNWGNDEEGRRNHDRVALVHAELKLLGLSCWFDEERMQVL